MITFYCWISPPDRDKLTDSILHSPRSTTLPRVRMNEKVTSSLQNKSEVARFTASTCAKLAVFISCWSRVAPWLVAEGFGVCVSECGLFFIGPFLSRPQRAWPIAAIITPSKHNFLPEKKRKEFHRPPTGQKRKANDGLKELMLFYSTWCNFSDFTPLRHPVIMSSATDFTKLPNDSDQWLEGSQSP